MTHKIEQMIKAAKESVKPDSLGYGYAVSTWRDHMIELRLIPCDSRNSKSSWGRQSWLIDSKVTSKAKIAELTR